MASFREMSWNVFVRLSMRRPVLIAAILATGLWAVFAVADEAATTPTIDRVRLGVDAAGQTRIVFDADERPDFVISVLPGEKLGVTIRGANFATGGAEGTGVVTAWTAEEETATIALANPSLPVRSFVLPPAGDNEHYRLVVDLADVTRDAYAAAVTGDVSAGEDRSTATPTIIPTSDEPDDGLQGAIVGLAPAPSLKPRTDTRPPLSRRAKSAKTIVIDPGHGGYDPGASGPTGLQEEIVTLEVATALRTILQARGYEVILTRDDDSFVELEDRIETARRAQADLFLSLHADGLDDSSVRGGSVYTLADKRAGGMARELRAEEGNFAVYDVTLDEDERDVGDILFDLASSTTRNESGRLAASLVDELSGTIPLVHNSHRKKSLRVLLSPDVPAVLLELAFISNPDDEKNLASPRWRRRSMTAVADGIDAYFAARVAQIASDEQAGG